MMHSIAVIRRESRAMRNAIRLARHQACSLFSSPLPYHIGRRSSSGIRFLQAVTGTNQHDKIEQDQKTNHHNEKTGDVMSEGYATRSDEEGFGGKHGRNDPKSKIEQDKIIHENHPAYDQSQGSEVAEKEKPRHQETADC